MPLMKGKGKKAFEHNVKAEMHAGKPQDQSLAIAYSVKRKAKKKAAGGSVESGSKDMNMADGGDIKGVHESFYDQGMSRAGAKARKPEKSDYDKAVARKEHIKVLSEQRSMPKPKLQGLAEGGEAKKQTVIRHKGHDIVITSDSDGHSARSISGKHKVVTPLHKSMSEAAKAAISDIDYNESKKYAEGGNVSAKSEKRPMPDNRYNDSAEAQRNSSNKPPKNDNWLDQPTVAQAQSNNGRMVKPIARPRMVPSNAFSTRLYDEESRLQSSASPGPYDEQPPRHDDEEGPDRQGPQVRDMQSEHSTGRKPYAKGGDVNRNRRLFQHKNDPNHLDISLLPESEQETHIQHSKDKEPLDVRLLPKKKYASGGKIEASDERHPLDGRYEDDLLDLPPSEDEGSEMAMSHNEIGPDRQGDEVPDMEREHSNDRMPYAEGGMAEQEMDHADSIAAAIMAKRDRMHSAIDSGAHDMDEAVRMAEGGRLDSDAISSHDSIYSDDSDQADLSRNADEDANEEDQLSFNSLTKENYSESEGLSQLDNPEDSAQHGDEEEKDSEDSHDMIDSISRKMAARKQFKSR